MRIDGPKKLVKRAIFVARLLDINPAVRLQWSKEGDDEDYSECAECEDGSFVITIQHWLEGQNLIEAIGHEMVHVWQHVRGDLITMHDEHRWIWKGQMYVDSGSMEEYFLRPWELEARSLEAWIEWRWRHK